MTYNNIIDKKSVYVTLYNPSAKKSEIIRIKVPHDSLEVVDKRGNTVIHDLICHEEKDYLPNTPIDKDNCDLYFLADLESFAFSSYEIKHSNVKSSVKEKDMVFMEDKAELKVDKFRKVLINEDL